MKSVHSRHGEVIKFVDISLETMFRATTVKSVLSTDDRYICEPKFPSAISETHSGGERRESANTRKKKKRTTRKEG